MQPLVPYKIRALHSADLPQVLAIEQEQLFPWTEKMLEDCLQFGYDNWVLESNKEIIGFGIIAIAAKQGEILNIAVKTNWRRKGLGRVLLQQLCQVAKSKQVREIYLEVRQSNFIAIALYEQFGFKFIGTREKYYQAIGGFEDARVYRLDLI